MLFGDFAEAQPIEFNEAIDEEETAEDYGYSSDSDLEDDEEESATSFELLSESNVLRSDPTSVAPVVRKIVSEEQEERTGKGKVVKIPDVAFVT